MAPHDRRADPSVNGWREPMRHVAAPSAELEAADTNKVFFLRRSGLFADAEGSVEAYEHLFRMELLPRRTRVFDTGDPARTLFVVKRGTVRIGRLAPDGKEITVALLGPGDIFGEEALFDPTKPRTTVATCLEETLLCISRADDLLRMLAGDARVTLNVAKGLSGKLEVANETIERVAGATVADRIVHLFRTFAAERGVRTADGVDIAIALTHAEIGNIVGCTRETASFEISKLVRSGRLRAGHGTFTLLE